MENVTIRITGKRYDGDAPGGEMEFVSDCRMYRRGSVRYYVYEESEFSGLPGCKTSLRVKEGSLRMKRLGPSDRTFGAELCFEKGRRFRSRYETPYGDFDIEVLTRDVRNMLGEDGLGRIVLDYDVSFRGMAEGRNEIDIEISR